MKMRLTSALTLAILMLLPSFPVHAQKKLSPEEALRILKEKERQADKAEDTPQSSVDLTDDGWKELASKHTLYVEIPLVGTFGEQIQAAGVYRALQHAANNPHVKHVVFSIDSGGGTVDSANDIASYMRHFDDELTYHAVVKNGISASIWIIFACDTIHMLPGGTMGGAVVFTTDRTTGDADVDKKQNSIIAAKIATGAEEKGFSGDIVRAMVVPEAAAYAYQGEDDKWVITGSKPQQDHVTIDDNDTVLTMTTAQATEHGVTHLAKKGAASVGETLGLSGWRKANDAGFVCMESVRLLEQVSHVAEALGKAKNLAPVRREQRDIELAEECCKRLMLHLVLVDSHHPGNVIRFPGDKSNAIVESVEKWNLRRKESLDAIKTVQLMLGKLRQSSYVRDGNSLESSLWWQIEQFVGAAERIETQGYRQGDSYDPFKSQPRQMAKAYVRRPLPLTEPEPEEKPDDSSPKKFKPLWKMVYETSLLEESYRVRDERGVTREVTVTVTDKVKVSLVFRNVSKSEWSYTFKVAVFQHTAFPVANPPVLGSARYRTPTLKPGATHTFDIIVPVTTIDKRGRVDLIDVIAE